MADNSPGTENWHIVSTDVLASIAVNSEVMVIQAKLRPPNSVLFVMDIEKGETPDSMHGRLISSTASSIAIATRSSQDGPTTIVITDDEGPEAVQSLTRVFKGKLVTPRTEISVCTARLQEVLRTAVQGKETNLEIWTDREQEPMEIVVVIC